MTKLFNGNHLDLYSINSDFTGSRYFTIDQEEVEFHNATTIRIWFNKQYTGRKEIPVPLH